MAQIRDLNHAFEVLGCAKNSTPDEIKAQYRRLQKKYHTDLYESQNLPEALKELATQKVQEINEAYGMIKKWIEQQAPPKQSPSNYEQKRDQASTTSSDSKRPSDLNEITIFANPPEMMKLMGLSLLFFFGGILMWDGTFGSICATLMGAACIAVCVWKLTTKRPEVILNWQGIAVFPLKSVPWEEVARISRTAGTLTIDFQKLEVVRQRVGTDSVIVTKDQVNIDELFEKINWFYDIQNSRPRGTRQ